MYSALMLQLLKTAHSTPPPSVQVVIVSLVSRVVITQLPQPVATV